ncbi:MAG: cupin domain-containing protein [Nitrospira sp.]|nr:cupin domain-containing protein [Nitrospira sp.]
MRSDKVTVDQRAVAREWRARGFSCDLWVDPPGQVWEDYRHATDEVIMLVAGRLELEFAGRCLTPAPGEEILIPAGVSHTVRNIGGTAAQWLYGYKRVHTG